MDKEANRPGRTRDSRAAAAQDGDTAAGLGHRGIPIPPTAPQTAIAGNRCTSPMLTTRLDPRIATDSELSTSRIRNRGATLGNIERAVFPGNGTDDHCAGRKVENATVPTVIQPEWTFTSPPRLSVPF